MKTKVIPSRLLDQFRKESYQGTERELIEAAPRLAQKLGIKELRLEGFTGNTVLYQGSDGKFVRAGYSIDHAKGEILLENFATVMVDDVSVVKENRRDLTKMMEALLSEDGTKTAEAALDSYLGRKTHLKECTEDVVVSDPIPAKPTHTENEIKANALRKLVQEALGTAALFEVETVVGSISKKLQLENNNMSGVDNFADGSEMGNTPSVSQVVLLGVKSPNMLGIVADSPATPPGEGEVSQILGRTA